MTCCASRAWLVKAMSSACGRVPSFAMTRPANLSCTCLLLIILTWATCDLASIPCLPVPTNPPSITESLNCAHSRVATIIMHSCSCQFVSAQTVHVFLSSSVPGVSRRRPHLVTNFFSDLRRCSISCDNHAAVPVFARPCRVCNSNGRYTFLSVFALAAGLEPLIAFECALIIRRCRSSTNTSVACMRSPECVCCFVCLFVVIKLENLYFTSRLGLQVKSL